MFKRLALDIDVGCVLSAPRSLVQVSDNNNRKRYKYTEWREEKAPGTPLLIYGLPKAVTDDILLQLPKALTDREMPGIFLMVMPKPCAESESLPPHVDLGRRAAINVYLKCGGETTEFYRADEETRTLSCVGSFTAQTGEAWLLDVSVPHAVMMRDAPERIGLTMSFRKTRYAELAAMLDRRGPDR